MDDEDEFEVWDEEDVLFGEAEWTADSIAALAAHEAAVLAPHTAREVTQDQLIAESLQGQVDVFVQKRAARDTHEACAAVTAYLKGELHEADPMMSERRLAFYLIEENLDYIEGESQRSRTARAEQMVEMAASLGRLDAVIEEGEDLCARSREDEIATTPPIYHAA